MRQFLEATYSVTFTLWAEPGEWGETYAFLRSGRLTVVEGLPMLLVALATDRVHQPLPLAA